MVINLHRELLAPIEVSGHTTDSSIQTFPWENFKDLILFIVEASRVGREDSRVNSG